MVTNVREESTPKNSLKIGVDESLFYFHYGLPPSTTSPKIPGHSPEHVATGTKILRFQSGDLTP